MGNKLIFFIILSSVLTLSCSDIPDYKESGKVLPEGTISINDNQFYTQSVNADMNLDVENAEEMCFSTDGTTYTAWEPYSTSKSVTLPSGHGQKTVYGKFKNVNGEITITDAIIPLVEEKIVASDGSSDSYFGGGHWNHTTANLTFSSDGNTMITSSPSKNKVYIYKKSSNLWSLFEILNCIDVGSNLFGQSIACTSDADYIVIGAMNRACIYIYKFTGLNYTHEKTIYSDTPAYFNDYSVTVSISDNADRILVGSWRYDSGAGKGRCYFYERTGSDWDSYTKHIFEDSAGASGDHFGLGVKISGDGNTIAVSAPDKNAKKGSLFIYKWNGSSWPASEYNSSDGVAGDMLGRHIGMSYDGNKIVVGTRAWNQGNANQGAAYLFEWNGSAYSEVHKFTASDGVADDKFGYSVAMSNNGDSIVISSPFAQSSGINGKTYVYRFRGSNWIEEAILTGSDSLPDEFYGNTTAISGDGSAIAVSASMDNIGINSLQGSVYLYY